MTNEEAKERRCLLATSLPDCYEFLIDGHEDYIKDYYDFYIRHLLDINMDNQYGVRWNSDQLVGFEQDVTYLLLNHNMGTSIALKPIIRITILNMYNERMDVNLRRVRVNMK